MNRADIRREFPVEKIAPLMTAAGRLNGVSARAKAWTLRGYQRADIPLVRAAIKAGLEPGQALQLAMLAADLKSGYVENFERVSRATLGDMLEGLAAKNPRSIWAYWQTPVRR